METRVLDVRLYPDREVAEHQPMSTEWAIAYPEVDPAKDSPDGWVPRDAMLLQLHWLDTALHGLPNGTTLTDVVDDLPALFSGRHRVVLVIDDRIGSRGEVDRFFDAEDWHEVGLAVPVHPRWSYTVKIHRPT